MKQGELERLHHIRDRRKIKALERVAASQAALQRAEQTLAEARAAVEAQFRQFQEQESGGLSAIIGKRLSHAEIANFHADLAFLSERLEALRAVEKDTEQKRDEAQSALKDANAVLRGHHNSVEKLQYVISQERQRRQSRNLAFSEAVDDEFSHHSKRSGQGKRPFDIGIGDA